MNIYSHDLESFKSLRDKKEIEESAITDRLRDHFIEPVFNWITGVKYAVKSFISNEAVSLFTTVFGEWDMCSTKIPKCVTLYSRAL